MEERLVPYSQVEALRAELEELRNRMSADVDSLHAQNMGLLRQLGAAKKKAARLNEEDPDAGEIKAVLQYAKKTWKKRDDWYIGPDGKRWKLVKAALDRSSPEKCRKAIDGLWIMRYYGQGRRATPALGFRVLLDIVYALGDEERQDRCEGYVDEANAPLTEEQFRPHLALAQNERRWVTWADPVTTVMRALDDRGLRANGQFTANRDSYMACCPAHDDKNPSLSITVMPNGNVRLWCFAGCEQEQVIRVLGLDWCQLWGRTEWDRRNNPDVVENARATKRLAARIGEQAREMREAA